MKENLLNKKLSEYDDKNLRKAYVELLSFLNLVDKKEYNKIPKDFIKYMEKNKDESYEKVVYCNTPIIEQNLMQETLDLIAFLNIRYWSAEEEADRLRKIYYKNNK